MCVDMKIIYKWTICVCVCLERKIKHAEASSTQFDVRVKLMLVMMMMILDCYMRNKMTCWFFYCNATNACQPNNRPIHSDNITLKDTVTTHVVLGADWLCLGSADLCWNCFNFIACLSHNHMRALFLLLTTLDWHDLTLRIS